MGAGIDARGLPADFQGHHLVINDWEDLAAPQNVCIISVPTQFDPALAPEGKGVVHAYVAANEPYAVWQGMDRRSQDYKDLKVGPPCGVPASPLLCGRAQTGSPRIARNIKVGMSGLRSGLAVADAQEWSLCWRQLIKVKAVQVQGPHLVE